MVDFKKGKANLKKTIPVFITSVFIIVYLITIPVVLYKYSIYLNKPPIYSDVWDDIKKYLTDSNYTNYEIINFNPNWLKYYAVEYYRFPKKKFNISNSCKNIDTCWLISVNKEYIPKNYHLIKSIKVKNLFVLKLKRIK